MGGLSEEEPHGKCDYSEGECTCDRRWRGDDCSLALHVWEPFPVSRNGEDDDDEDLNPEPRNRAVVLMRESTTSVIMHGGYTRRRCPLQKMYRCDFHLSGVWELNLLTRRWELLDDGGLQSVEDKPGERAINQQAEQNRM